MINLLIEEIQDSSEADKIEDFHIEKIKPSKIFPAQNNLNIWLYILHIP